MSDKTVNRTAQAGQPRQIVLGEFGSQRGPNSAIMASIHRGPDGYVPMAHKNAGGVWTELGALPVGQFAQPLIPALLDGLATDGYFALNTSWGTSRRTIGLRKVWKKLPPIHPEYGTLGADFPGAVEKVSIPVTSATVKTTGLPFQKHQATDLRWLNVCHVDIDCYKVGLSVGEVIGAIINMQDSGTLPPATMFARSGRGLWAFWYLLDQGNPETGTVTLYNAVHTPTTPQRAHPRAVAFYAKVQAALAARLQHLGADLGALDGCRFAPVPGTLKTTTDTRVEYWIQGGPRHGFAYTLRSLGEALELEMLDREHPIIEAALVGDPDRRGALSAAGKKGWKVRHLNLLADFHVLLNLRGGGFHANRHLSLYSYAMLLKRNGMSQEAVLTRVVGVARKCGRDAEGVGISDAEARTAARSAFRGKNIHLSAAVLFNQLQVTMVEATYLKTLRPTSAALQTKPRTTKDRRTVIHGTVMRLGRVPSCREMAAYIQTQGFDANFTTVARDYKTLGFPSANRTGRPKKARLPI